MSQASQVLQQQNSTTGQDQIRQVPPQQQQRRVQLKIESELGTILDLVSKYPILTVVAPTGTGKSIGIPWVLAKHGSARVFVSVPTVTAALSLAKFSKIYDPSVRVGYAAEGNVKYDDSDQIIYATSGHIRRKMINLVRDGKCMDLDFAAVLMIDEFHIGTIDNRIIYSLWNFCSRSQVQTPRLVLSSATLDKTKVPNSVFYQVTTQNYEVEIRYQDRYYEVDDPSLLNDVAKLVADEHASRIEGHFLVFVAGSADVEILVNSLKNLKNALVLPAYSELSQEQIDKIYQVPPRGTRKIIIATNVAETSITIKDIKIVFDTMTEKILKSSESDGRRLILTRISKSSAKQRCGRTGRTMPGICYRMITKEEYDTLDNEREEEIKRIPIHEVVMELMKVGLDPISIIPELTVKKYRESIKLLESLGMITSSRKVTEIGQFAPEFPLGVRNAALLWEWTKKYPLFPGVVVLSLIDSAGSSSYYWFPRRRDDQTLDDYQLEFDNHLVKYFEKFIGKCDVATMLNMWSDLVNTFSYPVNRDAAKKWAVENSINNKKIQEVLNIVRQVSNSLKRLGHHVEPGPFTTEGVLKALRSIISVGYSDKIFNQVGKKFQYKYKHPSSRTEYYLSNRGTVNDLRRDPPNKIVALLATPPKIGGRVGFINIAFDPQIVETPQEKAIRVPSTVPQMNKNRAVMRTSRSDQSPLINVVSTQNKRGKIASSARGNIPRKSTASRAPSSLFISPQSKKTVRQPLQSRITAPTISGSFAVDVSNLDLSSLPPL